IVVAAPAIWLSHTRDILSDLRFSGVHVCEGGRTRQESLYKAVKYIEGAFPQHNDDIVVSHDIARPFVTLRIIQENIAALKLYDAVDTVIPATDTIVESSDGAVISCIPDRTRMYQGQTPQTFYRRDYVRIYETMDAVYLERVTDAARILQENGLKVGLVQGDVFNIKITTEYDLRIASYLLDGFRD
nr:D-ribitol-5-phosphate cytidylyltransferase [Desulfovibrio sp.]